MAASPSALQNKQNIASRNDDELRASKPCCLVLLSGLPGSGKSLIAQLIMDRSELLLEALNQAFEKPQKSAYFSSISVQIVSYDHFLNQQLIDSPTAAFSPDLWHQSRELALNRVRERAAAASSSTSTSIYHVIVIDDNMNYRSMRRQVFQVAHELSCHFVQVEVKSEVSVCLDRNMRREVQNRVADHVIRQMAFDPVGASTHWWDVHVLSIDNTAARETNELANIVPWNELAKLALLPLPSPPCVVPVSDTKQARSINDKSVLHTLDLHCRQIVAKVMTEGKKHQALSKAVADFKQHFLARIRLSVQQSKKHSDSAHQEQVDNSEELLKEAIFGFHHELCCFLDSLEKKRPSTEPLPQQV